MEKIWYIEINEKREGPYNVVELKRDYRITPDTLVWRPGFTIWVPIGTVVELQVIFKDEESDDSEPKPVDLNDGSITNEKGVIALGNNSLFPYFLIAVAILMIIWAIYQMFYPNVPTSAGI